MKTKKIITTAMLIITIILSTCTYSNAKTTGSFAVSPASVEMDIGTTKTITISTTNCEGKFSITSSNSAVVAVSSASEWVSGSTNITLTAKSAGTAQITVTAVSVGDNQAEPEDVTGSKTVSVKVKEKVQQQPTEQKPAEEQKPAQNTTQTPAQNTTQTPAQNTTQTPAQNTTQTPAQNTTQTPTEQKPTVQEPTFKATNDTVYAKENVNVRDTWSTSGKVVGSLEKGKGVTRTGIGSNGWDRISFNGATAYVNQSYITTTKPEEPKPTEQEPTFKQVNDTVYAKSSVNIRDTWSTSGKVVGSLEKGNSVTRIGIGSNGWDKVSYNGTTAYINQGYITTTKVEEEKPQEKSSDKSLKTLTIEGFELSPKFDPETTKYSVAIDGSNENGKDNSEIKSLNIDAVANDEGKATVAIEGNENFQIGNNIVKILVTAEDGTVRTYTITVTKAEKNEVVACLKLEDLSLANATLDPVFSPDTMNYVIIVDDPSTITANDVTAIAKNKENKVTITETSLSETGDKNITIMVEAGKSEADANVAPGVYQISIKRPNVLNSQKDNSIYYILGGVMGVLVLLIILVIIALKKTSDKDDDDYDDDDEPVDVSKKDEEMEIKVNNISKAEEPKSQIFSNKIVEQKTQRIATKEVENKQTTKEEKLYDFDDDDTEMEEIAKKKGKHF